MNSAIKASEKAQGLRELADFLDTCPDLLVYGGDVAAMAHDAEEFGAIVRALSPCEKNSRDDYQEVKRHFAGDVAVKGWIEKSRICERVQVGTRIVPARSAQPEHEECVYEWRCSDSVLRGSDE